MPTTKRLLTDETGQALVTAVNNIVAAVKPNATEIQMSSSDTTTVATAITNINDKIGTVPSGQTVEDQITTLNSKLTYKEAIVQAANCQCTYSGVKFTRSGNVIQVKINGLVNLPNGSTNICTIPEGFRMGNAGSYSHDTIVLSANDGTSPRVVRFSMVDTTLRAYNYGTILNNNNIEPTLTYIALV